MSGTALERAASLACWRGPVTPEPLAGGMTNTNFVVADKTEKFFVRIGHDIPLHGVMRFNELAASKAAAACGISPDLVHHEAGALVFRFIDGRTLVEADFAGADVLERALALVRRVHVEMPTHLRGPSLMFWVFQICRDYIATARDGASRMTADLARLAKINRELEQAVGPIEPVFAHNDLLAGNFIDDGARLWLIDWDYAGWNGALFDLANLASDNQLTGDQETWLLGAYYGAAADADLQRRFAAMKCASLLRETLWSVVSEIHSAIDYDFAAYTAEHLARFERAYAAFRALP